MDEKQQLEWIRTQQEFEPPVIVDLGGMVVIAHVETLRQILDEYEED